MNYKKDIFLLVGAFAAILALVMGAVGIKKFKASKMHIEGRLIGYHKMDQIQLFNFIVGDELGFHLSKEVREDIYAHREYYAAYQIKLNIHNISPGTVYNVCARQNKPYENIWLDESSMGEGGLEIKPGQMVERSVIIIVKSEGMTEKIIETLIKSLNISIEFGSSDDPVDSLRKQQIIGFDGNVQ